jgi:hypothetical protein
MDDQRICRRSAFQIENLLNGIVIEGKTCQAIYRFSWQSDYASTSQGVEAICDTCFSQGSWSR